MGAGMYRPLYYAVQPLKYVKFPRQPLPIVHTEEKKTYDENFALRTILHCGCCPIITYFTYPAVTSTMNFSLHLSFYMYTMKYKSQ